MNQKKQPNWLFIEKESAKKVIMDLRATARHKFRIRLGFKQNDIIYIKEQSTLTKITSFLKLEHI